MRDTDTHLARTVPAITIVSGKSDVIDTTVAGLLLRATALGTDVEGLMVCCRNG